MDDQIKKDNIQISLSDSFRKELNEVSNDVKFVEEAEDYRELYLSIFERSNDLIFIHDFNSKLLNANNAFLKLLDYGKEDIPNLYLSNLMDSDELQYIFQAIENLKSNRKQDNLLEFRFNDKNGNYIYLEARSVLIYKNEIPYAIQVVARDISESKQLNKIQSSLYDISDSVNTSKDIYDLYKSIHGVIKELMPADNFFIAIYDQITDNLNFPYFVDQKQNHPEARPLGNALVDIVFQSEQDLFHTGEEISELIKNGEIEPEEFFPKVWFGVPLVLYGKTIGVMGVKDYNNEEAYGFKERQLLNFVSEQTAQAIDKKRSEEELILFAQELRYNQDLLEERAAEFIRLNEQLEQSENELKELNASKDKFFSIIAHDLRSPFSGLLGFSNILLEDFDNLSREEIKNFSIHINTYTKNLFNLIENLLSWSRIQTGRMPFQPIKVDIYEIASGTFNLLMGNCIKKNINQINGISEKTFVSADPNMIQSVVQNLVSNAIKFTKSGGNISINAVDEGDFLEISVADTGIGMKPEDQEKIFRIDSHHTTLGTAQEKGTGLGLLLCKDLVEKHGGKIWVESTFGEGTSFKFTLPKWSE